MLHRVSIGFRLVSMAAVSLIGFLVVAAVAMNNLRSSLVEDRMHEVKTLVEVMEDVIDQQVAEAKSGTVDMATARARILALVNETRYGDGDYFYILDREGVIRAHGGNRQLIGKNLSAVKDANGRTFIAEQLALAQGDGAGFVDYVWPKAGSTEPVPKVTYVKGMEDLDWVVATGLYIDDVDAVFAANLLSVGVPIGIVVILAAALAYAISRSITGPLTAITRAMRRLAANDTAIAVSYADHGDEIGDLARALDTFKANAIEMERLRREQETERKAAEDRRRRDLVAMAEHFEGGVSGIIRQIAAAAEELQHAATAMSATADRTSTQAETIAQGAEESSANAQTVAAAAEELGSSIDEIHRQVTQSNRIAEQAQTEVAAANGKVQGLAEAVNKIGQIVELITAIASQTNLLALNATIEAARAGDAGKGFAVVASEVKNLANQTAKATEDISAQIASIQGATAESVAAMGRIDQIVREVKEAAATIAAAVNQQGTATREITQNVQRTADATTLVSRNVAGVRDGAAETGRAASDVLRASQELASGATGLRTEVDGFVKRVRTG